MSFKKKAVPQIQLWVYYKGQQSKDFEYLLRHVTGRELVGSGYDFIRNRRDVSFEYYRESAAQAMAERLRAIPGVRKVKVFDLRQDG